MSQASMDRYEQLLARQLAMNGQTLSVLESHGIGSSAELRLDFAYIAPGEAEAESLKALLYDQTDYDLSISAVPGSKEWRVTGSTQPTPISREILDQWVDWMVTAGLEQDCLFDGWGAEI